MIKVGKHRGWLLVYEAQFWIILALSVLAALFDTQTAVVSVLLLVAFWGGLIWSLYGSTDLVRRVHIAFNWIAAAATSFSMVSNPSVSENPAVRAGEYGGAAVAVAFFAAWALYWHRSTRVKNSYPLRGEAHAG
jgi:hypothetical protein